MDFYLKEIHSFFPSHPSLQVKAIFRNLPQDIIQKGRDETWFLINQLQMTQDEMDQKGYHLPFNWK